MEGDFTHTESGRKAFVVARGQMKLPDGTWVPQRYVSHRGHVQGVDQDPGRLRCNFHGGQIVMFVIGLILVTLCSVVIHYVPGPKETGRVRWYHAVTVGTLFAGLGFMVYSVGTIMWRSMP